MKTTQLSLAAAAAPGQAMMKAIVQHRYGTRPEDVLALDQVATPAIAADEVLVQVRAAAVDRGTWHLMAGQPRGRAELPVRTAADRRSRTKIGAPIGGAARLSRLDADNSA